MDGILLVFECSLKEKSSSTIGGGDTQPLSAIIEFA